MQFWIALIKIMFKKYVALFSEQSYNERTLIIFRVHSNLPFLAWIQKMPKYPFEQCLYLCDVALVVHHQISFGWATATTPSSHFLTLFFVVIVPCPKIVCCCLKNKKKLCLFRVELIWVSLIISLDENFRPFENSIF